MEKAGRDRQDLLNELHTKWTLIDMNSKIVQTICSLLDDEIYTKNDAAYSLLEVLALIELEEKKDIVEQFVNEEKFKVIPHVAYPVNKNSDHVWQHHAISMTRYAPQKALNEAINAFQYVVDEIPVATYSIYGYGELKGELQRLINRLGIQDNVFLESFALNPLKCY